jgi:hypothetical protein
MEAHASKHRVGLIGPIGLHYVKISKPHEPEERGDGKYDKPEEPTCPSTKFEIQI